MLLLGSHYLDCEAGHGRGHVLVINCPDPLEVVVNSVVDGLLAVQLALLYLILLVDEGLLRPGEAQYDVS